MNRGLWMAVAAGLASLAAPSWATVYYVDATGGNDTKDGMSPTNAWRTLTKVSGKTFLAGDQILFKAGEVFAGQLYPKGSGADGSPIVIDTYGTGAKPVIDGGGTVTDAVKLLNQKYWEIRNLDIKNYQASGTPILKRGVYIDGNNAGTLTHIHLLNLDIHDVNGDLANKENGGIVVNARGTSTPTRFDDLRIEGCHIRDVDRTGLSTTSTWDQRSGCTPADIVNWFPSTNVVIRNNVIERAACNGMIVRTAESPLIEFNTFIDNGVTGSGNAFFCFNTNNALVQYNEAYGTVYNTGDEDAGGFDGDYRCCGSIFQYNYSHDNGMAGFVVVCDGNPTTGLARFNDGAIIRYNILQDNAQQAFRLSGDCTTNTQIYNNVIYIGPGMSNVDILLHKSWGGYADHTQYYNNIVYNLGSNNAYDLGGSTNNVFDSNLFFGNHPASEPADPNKLTGDPRFVDPGTGGIGLDTVDGYQLLPGSPCIDSGLTLANQPGVDYWGLPVPSNGAVDRGAHERPLAEPPITGCGSITTVRGAGADAYVRGGTYANTNFGSETYLYLKSTPTLDFARKVYVRFDLPPPASPLTRARLTLTHAIVASGNDGPKTIAVHGLNDGMFGEGWAESAITWNNAPGNDTAGIGVLPSATTLLDSVSVPASPAVGTTVSIDGPALVNFLNADTDGLVTFILTVVEGTGQGTGFGPASKEYTPAGGAAGDWAPTLVLADVPQDVNGDGVVDGADYAVFGECFAGPGAAWPPPPLDQEPCWCLDQDSDDDVDLIDFGAFQTVIAH